MNKIINKRIIYLLFLFVFILAYQAITPTTAKFSNDYVTDNDVVGLQLNFNLGISNFEEYEEIKVESNSYEVFNINITNSTTDNIYYGIWYKMVSPREINNDILIGRLEDNDTSMSGEIASIDEKTASVIIKNNSANDIVISIGIASSSTSTSDIEYLGGKHLITGSYKEVDYIYDDTAKKYVSSTDSNKFFFLNQTQFENTNSLQKFTSNHLGAFQVEAWGAGRSDDDKGSYTTGIISLKENDSLYISVGSKESTIENAHLTDIRLISNDNDANASLSSRIMIAGSEKSSSYISGNLGSVANPLLNKELEEKCTEDNLDITCSYHFSGTIFKHTKIIQGNSEMSTFDGKEKMIGNTNNGFAKITPVVPLIDIPTLKINIGNQLDTSSVHCKKSLNGCHIIRVLPQDTTSLKEGTYSAFFMVSDNDGIVYRYASNFEVVGKE